MQDAIAYAATSLSRGLPVRSAGAERAGPGRAIALTAGAPREGVTTVTASLAQQMAALLGLQVLVVGLGRRTEDLSRTFVRLGAVARPVGDADLSGAFQALPAEGVRDLPGSRAGEGGAGSIGLVALPRAVALPSLLEHARAGWDITLVDAPAFGSSVDALLAARGCGAAVLVMRAGHLPWETLCAARDRLAREEVEILGTIVNRQRPGLPRWLERVVR